MPAESAQERTEPPTARRRQEARRRGQIGRSSDLTAAATLLGVLIAMDIMGRSILGRFVEVLRFCLGNTSPAMTDPDQMAPTLVVLSRVAAGIVLPIMLVALVLALVTSFLQVGALFTLEPIRPSFAKLNPISGLRRMFNAGAFVHLVMGVAKMALLTAVAYATLRSRFDLVAHAGNLSHLVLIGMGCEVLFTLGIRLAVALLVLALIDFIYQRWKTERDLKMTKEEVKEELKNMDGDPKIRHRRRQIQMQLVIQRIRAAVPKADVVVTNPTELAVAIRYDAQTMAAPKVTAKGAGFLAQKIRELAIESGVPIVERRPLAQALYRGVEVGQEIPAQFYKAVAEVLAYVYELAGRGYRRQPVAGAATA